MKASYERPMMFVQNFVPNEYVAACYTLVCAIPGSSATMIGDGTTPRWFIERNNPNKRPSTGSIWWGGNYVEADGLLHGNCGNESTSYDVDNEIGYEHNNDGTVKNAIISEVDIGSLAYGNAYYATWKSDNGYQDPYVHYGYALMNSNPNHS